MDSSSINLENNNNKFVSGLNAGIIILTAYTCFS